MGIGVKVIPAMGDNYIYLLSCDGRAIVVDPGEAGPVLTALNTAELDLDYILITHYHRDHTAGCRELKAKTRCTVIGPEDQTQGVDRCVRDGHILTFGTSRIRVMETPGHTRAHVCYYLEKEGFLFSGDTLFVCGCGRIIGCAAEDLWSSLVKLRALPDDTQVYCGHDYTVENLEFAVHTEPENTALIQRLAAMRALAQEGKPTVPARMADEKRTNPFLRSDTKPLQKAMQLPGGTPSTVFAELRRRKDFW